MFIAYYAVLSTLPLYLVSSFHAEKSIVGLIVSAYTIASVTVRPFSGFALDRFGRKGILYTTLVLYAFFYLGYLVALSIAALLLLRIVHGITWGAVTISNTTQAIDIIPAQKKGEGIGYYALSTTMAMSVGPIVGLFFFHQFGYVVMFSATFVIGLIGFVCVMLTHVPTYVPAEKVKLNWNNLFDKGSILPSVNLLVFMLSYGGLISFISLYGKEIGVHNTSLFFLVFALGIAISRFASGKVFDRQGPRKILSFCALFLIAGFLVLAFIKTVLGFYCAAVIIGFGIGVVFPIFQAMVNKLAQPEHRGAANSTVYTALDLGMGLGMLFMGIIAQHTSIATAFVLCSAICVVGLLFFRVATVVRYEKNIESRKEL